MKHERSNRRANYLCQCNKSYAWKPELAGKRVKCKCGAVIEVPHPPVQPDVEEDLYDVAPSDEPVKPKRPSVQMPVASASASARTSGGVAVPYQSAPTKPDRMSDKTLMDMNRDVHVPIGLLAAGVIAYLSCFAFKYHLTGYGIAITSVGLFVMTALKAALMVGFALFIANPLGVSFGGIWTAALKLAAVAVFCDGITSWVDLAVVKMSGGAFGSGLFGWGIISFPVAIGIYWSLLIYLFSMDSGDSWLVVILLAIFDRIVKLGLVVLVLGTVLHMGGVSTPGLPSVGSSKAMKTSELAERVDDLKDRKLLMEAKKYIADGHQAFLSGATEAWYKAGAKNVWFEVSRDFNGKTSPEGLIIEMPDDANARKECIKIRDDFYEKNKMGGAGRRMMGICIWR